MYRRSAAPAAPLDAMVVRVSDGWTAKFEMPGGASFGLITFPGKDALWGALVTDASGKAHTIVRIPYGSMTVLQATMPAGDAG